MAAVVLLLVGLVLCFYGARSLRLGALAAGFGTTWLVADAFGASTGTATLIAAAGALGVLLLTVLMSRVLLFAAGVCAGGVIGARLLVLVNAGSDIRWLLALVFVPTIALLCGFLAATFKHRFLAWGTALAGAALVLAGIGRIGADTTDEMWRPSGSLGATVLALAWLALTVTGHRYQHRDRAARQHVAEPAR